MCQPADPEAKTLITHARPQAARFLGYEITALHNDHKITKGIRRANGTVSLRVPATVIKGKSAPTWRAANPRDDPGLRNEDDHTIVSTYGEVKVRAGPALRIPCAAGRGSGGTSRGVVPNAIAARPR